MPHDAPLSLEARRILALMSLSGKPLVVSAKIERRPQFWRDDRGRVRHSGYPMLTDGPRHFTCEVAGQRVPWRGLQALLRRCLLEYYRPGWKVRARYRLKEKADG